MRPVTDQQIMDILIETGVVLDGHFRLTSGRHSARYLQCAMVLQYPEHAARLGQELAARVNAALGTGAVDVVAGPALGGVIVAHEVARALGTRALFTERSDGEMMLRRGFSIEPGERVLVVEDVVTTGSSLLEAARVASQSGGVIVAAASIIDRRTVDIQFDVPFFTLVQLEVATYDPVSCPLCAAGVPVIKPGSRVN